MSRPYFLISYGQTFCLLLIIGTAFADDGLTTKGLLQDKINNTLIEIAASIGDIPVDQLHADSGLQEFGEFNLTTLNGTIHGLGDFVAEIINVQLIPFGMKNLTLHFRNITFDFNEYDLSGFIKFPLGDQQFNLTGHGHLRATIADLVISVYATLGYNSGEVIVKKLTMYADIADIQLSMEELMGGGKVGEAFETVLNDVVITIFDYYKQAIVDAYSEIIKDIIAQLINSIIGETEDSSNDKRLQDDLLRKIIDKS